MEVPVMKPSVKSVRRLTVATALALLVGAGLATSASADPGNGKAWGRRGKAKQSKHVEVYRPAPRVVHEYWRPAPRRVVYVTHRPFYASPRHGIYLPKAWINVQFGNLPPRGYVFYDPYCRRTFASVAAYRAYNRGCHHDLVLDVVSTCDLRWRDGCAYYASDFDNCGDWGSDYVQYDYENYGDDTHWSVSGHINID
jgi:hypothetical protein